MKNLTILFMAMLFTVSCNNEAKNTGNPISNSDTEQELLNTLDGEWTVQDDWSDSTLITAIIQDNINLKIHTASKGHRNN